MSAPRCVVGHITHPDARMAAALVAAQLTAQWDAQDASRGASAPTLGVLYLTDHLSSQAEDVIATLRECLPKVPQWLGTVGYGVLAEEAEYIDEPALAVMLFDLPAEAFCLFSGRRPLPASFEAQTAWLHADSRMTELRGNLQELAARMGSGAVFGGLSTSRNRVVQVVQHADQAVLPASEVVLEGGLSGLALSPRVAVQSRLTHGCKPIGPVRVLTEAKEGVLFTLNGEPALDVLLDDLQVSLSEPLHALQLVRQTLAAIQQHPLASPGFAGQLAPQSHVRGLLGVDPTRSALALGEPVPEGGTVQFCQRDLAYAKADLMRMCAELRDALEPDELDALSVAQRLDVQAQGEAAPHAAPPMQGHRIAGALYVSCVSRGGGYFGDAGAEMKLLRHALGDVPLVGMLAGGEIADSAVHGFSGVLTLFLSDAEI